MTTSKERERVIADLREDQDYWGGTPLCECMEAIGESIAWALGVRDPASSANEVFNRLIELIKG